VQHAQTFSLHTLGYDTRLPAEEERGRRGRPVARDGEVEREVVTVEAVAPAPVALGRTGLPEEREVVAARIPEVGCHRVHHPPPQPGAFHLLDFALEAHDGADLLASDGGEPRVGQGENRSHLVGLGVGEGEALEEHRREPDVGPLVIAEFVHRGLPALFVEGVDESASRRGETCRRGVDTVGDGEPREADGAEDQKRRGARDARGA
jgi:hypothetical protein